MMRSISRCAVWIAMLALLFCGTAWADAPVKTAKRPAAARRAKPARTKTARVAVTRKVTRLGSVIGLNRETVDRYVLLHKYVWPEVLKRLHDSNIRNYTIFMGELEDGNLYLFSSMEYIGDNLDADMKAIANDPITREWWTLTDPLQKRLQGTKTGSQWKAMEEVFHTD